MPIKLLHAIAHYRYLKKPLTEKDIYHFLLQTSTLVNSGISLHECFGLLETCQTKFKMSMLSYSLKKEIQSGRNLSQALKSFPQYFDALIIQLIQLGEQVGQLDLMLERAADYQLDKINFKKRLKHLAFYPMVTLIISLIIIYALLLFVVPKFSELFSHAVTSLPWITSFLFYLSGFICDFNQVILSLMTLLLVCFFICKHFFDFQFWLHVRLKKKLQALLYSFPLGARISMARFTKYLAITCHAGLPLINCIELSTSNELLTTALKRFLNAGFSLHQAMQETKMFPIIIIHMVKIGEETGRLPLMLAKISSLFEHEISQTLDTLTKLLEPLIILMLGVLIGGIVIGMYLPIFKLGSAL